MRFAVRRSIALAVLLAATPGAAAPARADEVEELRRENEALRTEVEALRTRLAAVMEGNAPRPPGRDAPAEGTLEAVRVPRSRVSLAVEPDHTGGESITTLWHRTVVSARLPRREWFQLRAERAAGGRVTGAWLVLERHGGGGSVKVPAGRIEVDGRVVDLPVAEYDATYERRTVGTTHAPLRLERVRFTLSPDALSTVAGATRSRFLAGASAFDLTDEHVAAFAGLAARLATPAREAAPSAAATPD